jgi:diacylglycerol kinase (ATP)
MRKEKKVQRKMARRLEDAQQKHDKLLKKMEKARTKFNEREQALRLLEARLAKYRQALEPSPEQAQGQAPTPPIPPRPARLIYNPKSEKDGNPEHTLEAVINCLRRHGIEPDVTLKTSGNVIRKSARKAVKNSEDLIIVAGGDGTIEDVAAELVGSETTMGILPIGTMNNIARSLGVPLDVNDACTLISMGVARKIDIGHVDAGAAPHLEYFLETAGLGLNAIAFQIGQEAHKRRWGGLPDAMRKLLEFKATPIVVELDDGQKIPANSQVVTVSNAPMTGMNFLLAPEAKMDDGWLDIAIYDDMNKADLFSYLMAARNANRVDNEKIKRYRSRHVRIYPRQPAPIVSDKDALPEKDTLDIELIPQGLKVIVGKGAALTFPVEVAPSVPPLTGPQRTNGHAPEPSVQLVAPGKLADKM